jgi:hypothetical protein
LYVLPKNDPHIRVLAAFLKFYVLKYVANTARFKGPYEPIGEVEICRIWINRAIIGHILHRNRKQAFYGVFSIGDEN